MSKNHRSSPSDRPGSLGGETAPDPKYVKKLCHTQRVNSQFIDKHDTFY